MAGVVLPFEGDSGARPGPWNSPEYPVHTLGAVLHSLISPFAPLDNNSAVMIVCRIRWKIIRTVLCCVV